MTNSRIRRRRKSTPSISQIDEQEILLPKESTQESGLDTSAENGETITPQPSNVLREQGSWTIGDINQIRAELREETSYPVVEPEYWDDSHNWGKEYGTESPDYWHFLGRYE
ncbi:MAG: hypothetical protein AAFO95_17300 [Cyanobacteria bacterium J06600_6]